MIIAQASLRLPTLKATLKCAVVCVFFFFWGGVHHHLPHAVQHCGLWNVGPLLFSGYAQCVTYPVSLLAIQELGDFSFQELCAYPYNMGPCIMLQPELMVVDEWHQDLVKLFLCIQSAINKMHLCLLTYTCPCHNSIHKSLANTTPYTLKSALSRENQDSSLREHLFKVPDPIKCEHSPTAARYNDELQTDGAHKDDDAHAD